MVGQNKVFCRSIQGLKPRKYQICMQEKKNFLCLCEENRTKEIESSQFIMENV